MMKSLLLLVFCAWTAQAQDDAHILHLFDSAFAARGYLMDARPGQVLMRDSIDTTRIAGVGTYSPVLIPQVADVVKDSLSSMRGTSITLNVKTPGPLLVAVCSQRVVTSVVQGGVSLPVLTSGLITIRGAVYSTLTGVASPIMITFSGTGYASAAAITYKNLVSFDQPSSSTSISSTPVAAPAGNWITILALDADHPIVSGNLSLLMAGNNDGENLAIGWGTITLKSPAPYVQMRVLARGPQ